MCAYVGSFPMVDMVIATEGGKEFSARVLGSLLKARPTIPVVTVRSGFLCLKWRVDAMGSTDN
jgi:hypothetical protein